jgi:hypothetical protein
MPRSKRSAGFILVAWLLITVLLPLSGSIQVGFPVLARSSTNQNNAYANWTGALTAGDCVSIDANKNFVDSGVAGCGGAGAGKGGIVVYSAASLSLTGTQYIPIGGGGLPSGTETFVDTSAPSAATVTNFDVQMSSAPGMGNNIVFTWRKNASSQTLTCTISGAVATSCNDSTHSFLVSQGDLLTIQLVTTGVIAGTPNLVIATQFGTTGSNGTVNTATQFQVGEYLANGTAISGITVSPCLDSGGNHLNFNSATGAITCGTTSSTVSPTTNQNIRTIGATFGSFESGASALSGSHTACVATYFAGTIQSVELIGDVSGSATVDVLTVAHTSWTGRASTSSITAAAIPALSSAARFTDSTLTGWTTSLTAGTDVCFALTSPTTVAGVAIAVKVAAN